MKAVGNTRGGVEKKKTGTIAVGGEYDNGDREAKFESIAEVIDSYGRNDNCLISILHAAQEIYGYLPIEVQEFIAERMNIPLSRVSGVVSFYSFFSVTERGEHTVRVCLGTACYVRGGKQLIAQLEEKLGAKVGQTSSDKKFTFEIVRCIGACGLAPAIMIDDEVYKQVTERKLDGILAKYRDCKEDKAL